MAQRRRTSTVAVASCVVLLLIAAPNNSVGLGSFASTGDALQRWVATNGAQDQTVTQAEAKAIARRFDVVVARQRTFAPYVSAMRRANPRLLLLVYLNGVFSSPERSYPEAMYAHDARGERLYSTKWKRWMMDVGNPRWADNVAEECTHDLAASGYDGCYVDMLGTAPLNEGYVSSTPVNPRTGTAWTKDEYIAATSAIGSTVERANSRAVVVGNGLANGKRYFAPHGSTAPLLNGLDGGNAEGWIRGAHQAVNTFRKEVDWRRDVDMLVHAGQRGRSVLAMTKVWVRATQPEIDRWHKYALASFMLGNDGRSFFSFYSDRDRQSLLEARTAHPWDDLAIGAPTGAYRKADGVYRRDFTNGTALVNPTGSPATVRLGGTYRDLDGVIRSSVTLPPNTGEVLLAA